MMMMMMMTHRSIRRAARHLPAQRRWRSRYLGIYRTGIIYQLGFATCLFLCRLYLLQKLSIHDKVNTNKQDKIHNKQINNQIHRYLLTESQQIFQFSAAVVLYKSVVVLQCIYYSLWIFRITRQSKSKLIPIVNNLLVTYLGLSFS